MYYAHSLDKDESEWQKLQDHLVAAGDLASGFAAEFGASPMAQTAGLLHDLGKYSAKFQARLRGSAETVDHSIAGAKEIRSRQYQRPQDLLAAHIVSYAIAGHHAGLADAARLLERLDEESEPLDECWQQEIFPDTTSLWPGFKALSKEKMSFQLAFLGRMVFSCLVDADYKDTENFYAQHDKKVVDRHWPDLRKCGDDLRQRFDKYMQDKQLHAAATPVNLLRKEIIEHVRGKASMSPGLFTLTVPTGGGKTLASLGFALDHAKQHDKRRIIYAIPFTSIIDQTAGIFRAFLGEEFVLEHHSSIDQQKFKERGQQDKLRLAMEDWAAPVVVTTNVQLFESLFANRSSHCRKLHNLANSIIILDEAQTLPARLLHPCLAALDELARHYGTTIVLCTATQPALDIADLPKFGLPLEGRELAPDPANLAQQLRRVTINRVSEVDDETLVQELEKQQQALVIVNSRRHAISLYNAAKQAGLKGVIHLSTRQYASHRRLILDQVRQKLAAGEPCLLIATSLIEAGVDVDFPRVWRAEAGLDQIAQAAGRCNREGRWPVADSIVTVFRPKDHKPPREIAQLVADCVRATANISDLLSPEAIRAYFKEVFWRKGPELLDEKQILSKFNLSGPQLLFDYQSAAQDFRMIESGLIPVIINDNPAVAAVLERLKYKEASPGKAARELQGYMVQVPPKDVQNLIASGQVAYYRQDLWDDQFAVLQTPSLYQPETGLMWERAGELAESVF